MQGDTKLTHRELHLLEDCLMAEQLTIKKCNTFGEQTTDPEVGEICKNLANKHQQHYNTLLQHLQNSADRAH